MAISAMDWAVTFLISDRFTVMLPFFWSKR